MDPQLKKLLDEYLATAQGSPNGVSPVPDPTASPYSDSYQAYAQGGKPETTGDIVGDAAGSLGKQALQTLVTPSTYANPILGAAGLGLSAVGDVVGAVGSYQQADKEEELKRIALLHDYAAQADQQGQSDKTQEQNRLAQLWQLRGGR